MSKTPHPKTLTLKSIKEWINAEFKRLEMPCEVSLIIPTRYRGHDYEAGASKMIIEVKWRNIERPAIMYSFHSIKDFKYQRERYGGDLHLELSIRQGFFDAGNSYITLKK